MHADDRAYLAAETHAFLVFVLGDDGAVVANPVGDGALGDEAVRAGAVDAARDRVWTATRAVAIDEREPALAGTSRRGRSRSSVTSRS